MPEGDTIFRTARNLGRALVGKPVTAFRSTFPWLIRFNDNTPLAGQTVNRVEARGKWLLVYFSGGGILTSHLLMNGRWHIYRRGGRWQLAQVHMRIAIENAEYEAVGFRVPVALMHTAHRSSAICASPAQKTTYCARSSTARRRSIVYWPAATRPSPMRCSINRSWPAWATSSSRRSVS